MQFGRVLLVVFLAPALLSGCSMEKDPIVMSPLPNVEDKFSPSIIWHRSVGNGIGKYYSQLSPAYDDSVVYAADRQGTVKAITFDSGKILWSIDLSEHVGFFSSNLPALLSSGLTISGDKIYLGTERGKVIALNKTNGSIEWKTDAFGEVLSQPVVSNNLLLIHTSNGILQALDVTSGQNKWSLTLESSKLSIRGKSAPAIDHGIAIIGSYGGRINAVMLDQGEILWRQYISTIHGATEIDRLHDVNITPVIDINSGTVFVIAYNGNIAAIDIRSHQIIWKRNFGSVNDIILAKNNIYLVDQNDLVLALNKYDGCILWTQEALLHRHLTAPVIYDDYLVLGDGEGYLHWLEINGGKFAAKNRVNRSGLRSRPVIASGKLLIQANDGVVYLIAR
ncbi:MAG: outer membrane protein assembly factor BamB [Candidatus Arsenophonus melophagi]|nr:outer membrane protein assembly factor BamB [Candidatus Arsenophonus melophagi]